MGLCMRRGTDSWKWELHLPPRQRADLFAVQVNKGSLWGKRLDRLKDWSSQPITM